MDGRSWARRTTRSLRSAMKDFWLSCGHHLLDRDRGGGLVVTDDFLKAYLARREVTPPPEACVAERTLHAVLLAEPRRPVDADHIAAIADADARENWAVMIAWRDLLIAHRTIEAAYLHLVRAGMGKTPPLFINQLVHVMVGWLRHLIAIDCRIEPLAAARGIDFTWYVGLDAQATAIGDALWSGETLDSATQMQLIGLYRLTVEDRAIVLDAAGGEP